MTQEKPLVDQINLVVEDMAAAVAFYRQLGVTIPDPKEWPPKSGALHAEAETTGGARLEIDNRAMAAIWRPSWRDGRGGSRVVVGFSLPSRAAVDERYAKLTAVGYASLQPPYDAFWGARYAIVQD